MMNSVRITAICLLTLLLCATACQSTGGRRAGIPSTRVAPEVRTPEEGTGVSAGDLIEVTDKMSRVILDAPEIQNAANPPMVGVLRVINDTRFRIDTELFTQRILNLLLERGDRQVRYVAREHSAGVERERELKDKGLVTSSGDRPMAGIDFFLTGQLKGLSQVGSAGQSDYIMYTFQLIDASSGIEIRRGWAEIKKYGLEDAIYR
ncbi:MAG: penicillin-binding protein activator LpoB [bacterium]